MCEDVTLQKQTFMNRVATAVSFAFEQNKAPFPKVCYWFCIVRERQSQFYNFFAELGERKQLVIIIGDSL